MELVAERTEMLGQPFAHLMKSDGRGNFTVVAKDELVDDRVVSSADLNNFDEARRDVAAKSDDGFLRDANLKEEDVETFSIPEDLMEQVCHSFVLLCRASSFPFPTISLPFRFMRPQS